MMKMNISVFQRNRMLQVFLVLAVSYSVPARAVDSCPSYCSCDTTHVSCRDGYELDALSLRLMSSDIQSLDINNFIIREISASHLNKFKHVVNLSITDSRLRWLHEDSLLQLTSLQSLNVSNNHIVQLADTMLSNQHDIQYISFADNLIEQIPVTLFKNTTSLHTLILHNNRIRLLHPTVFDSLTSLQHLDLSRNELSYILPRTFNFISLVRLIDLSDNLIITIHEDLFESNNITMLTKLSMAGNPLACNCGLVWLRKALLGEIAHIELVHSDRMICANPQIYEGTHLSKVSLEKLSCVAPTAAIKEISSHLFIRTKTELMCQVSGNPYPSIVWKTPMLDLISDPYKGEWLDSRFNYTIDEKTYQIFATGETVRFHVRSSIGYSILYIDSLHLVSSGVFECISVNPGGNTTASINLTLSSAIDAQYYPSLLTGGLTVLIAIAIGTVGCGVTACIEKCSCCESFSIKYYDGAWMNCPYTLSHCNTNNIDCDVEDSGECPTQVSGQDEDELDDDDVMVCQGAAGSISSEEPGSSSYTEINEHTALTAEEWDAYFREYPDDFIVESFDGSPKKLHSAQGSPRGSPTHRHNGKTLETLEGVRVRLKLRVEQIDVMKERLRVHMEKRSARLKENMEKKKLRMNKRMQTIKETTSQSLQSIRETGRNYSHKLHMGVRSAMVNVGAQVQSLKEFCGTGDLGQTLSIATMATDIDTNEKTAVTRSVTMV